MGKAVHYSINEQNITLFWNGTISKTLLRTLCLHILFTDSQSVYVLVADAPYQFLLQDRRIKNFFVYPRSRRRRFRPKSHD